nr:MAG TPA_asm: hypothetical protein [Caudoviricetes sp.]
MQLLSQSLTKSSPAAPEVVGFSFDISNVCNQG